MKFKTITAYTGPKGVGKSTISERDKQATESCDQSAEILSFATPIKEMLRAILPPEAFTTEGKDDVRYGLCGKTPRFLMQTLGTEWGRKIVGETIWTDVMKNKIHESKADKIFIDDLRFDNEAIAIKELNGEIIKLEREEIGYSEEHESEKPISEKYIDKTVRIETLNSKPS